MPRGVPKSGKRKLGPRGGAGETALVIVATIVRMLLRLSPEVRDVVLALIDDRLKAEAPKKTAKKTGAKPKPKIVTAPVAAPRPPAPVKVKAKAKKKKKARPLAVDDGGGVATDEATGLQ
jgi:hypothetical protein